MEEEKKKVLIVVDVQNDFVTGSLGTPEAQAIIPNVKEKFDEYKNNGDYVILTKGYSSFRLRRYFRGQKTS